MAELVRAGETDGHALVLVDLVRRDGADEPWRRLGRAISAAGDLREVFSGSQTLAVVALSRAVALVPDGWRLGGDLAVLRDRLRRTFGTRPGPAPGMFTVDDFEIRVVPLPDCTETAFAMLADGVP